MGAQQHLQAAMAHAVLESCWRRKYAECFRQLETGAWDARLQPLVAEVIARRRAMLLERIGDAYKVIPVSRISLMLGVDGFAAKAACEQQGWAVDAAGNAMPVS